jgi:Glycosyl hydrolase family 79 C-terminal beta domain
MKRVLIVISGCILACATLAQSPITLTINTRAPGYAVPTNFAGLSMSAHNFLALDSAADAQMLTLFRNIGLHSLRLGFGASVSNPNIDALFTFQRALTNLQVILQLPFSNIPDTVSAAQYIWSNYQSQFYAFALANEPDKSANWTTYDSFFTQWTNFAMAVTSAVPGAVFEGPDPAGQSWGAQFANDLKGSGLLRLISLHWYVGGNPNKYDPNSTPQKQIDNMLSSSWVTSLYPSTYNNALVPAQAAGFPLRFTEADDCVGGVTNASNAFAAALWALDFLHWWADHGCAGVNFMNTAWIPTDTIYPDDNGNCQINPKAYGIKAFDMGSTGYEEPVTISNTDGLNLTAYVVGDGTNLYVTIINKEHNAGARNASVTITPSGFLSGSVAAMYLAAPDGDAGAMNGVTLGGAFITNNAPWNGQWTTLSPLTNGQCTVTVPATSAAVVKIQASALLASTVFENWTASSDKYTNNAAWAPALALSTGGPSNNDGTGNSYDVIITNGGTCYYGGASGDPVWTNAIGQLWMGGVADGLGGGLSNTFFMSGGSLTLADTGASDFSIGGNVPGIGVIPSTNFFIMTGGTLNAMASTGPNWIALAPGSVATVNFNGGTANFSTLGIGGRGKGTVNINGGDVTIGSGSALASGTILVAAGGTLDASALTSFNLNSGQTLTGNGTVIGPAGGSIDFNSGSTLSVGLSATNIGILTISNKVVFNAGSTDYVVVNKTASLSNGVVALTVANDKVIGPASVTLGGTLIITASSGIIVGRD